jgi:hypothetical protein
VGVSTIVAVAAVVFDRRTVFFLFELIQVVLAISYLCIYMKMKSSIPFDSSQDQDAKASKRRTMYVEANVQLRQ